MACWSNRKLEMIEQIQLMQLIVFVGNENHANLGAIIYWLEPTGNDILQEKTN